jgi:uncharacterized RDD family membrane protein YckC
MSEQKTIPRPWDTDFLKPSPAFDPVVQAQLFNGLIGKRCIAFMIDAIIISLLWLIVALVVGVLGILTFGLAWLMFGSIFPICKNSHKIRTIFLP